MFVAGYLLLNHAMCGAFTGGHQPGTSESFLSLARRACLALVNESQMFAFCLFWTATFFAVLGRKAFRRKRDKNSPATSDGLAFIFLGLLCNGTMLVLRFILPFDTLGFRLLCPGTTLLTFGLILHVRNRLDADWSAALDAIPIRRFLALLTVLAIPATHLTAIEYGIRHVLNLPADALHSPYRTMRARLTAAYADRPAGARLSVPSCQDENFWINFLRPDLLADADDLPEKGF